MDEFWITLAPVIVVILTIIAAFFVAAKTGA